MIIADFGAVRVTVSPDETHAPLIVDPDAPLSLSQSFQTLQAVSGRNAQVLEASGVVQHSELAPGDSLDWGRQLARHLPFPDLARLVILKRRNHESNTIVSRKYLQAFVKLFRFLSTVRKQFPKSLGSEKFDFPLEKRFRRIPEEPCFRTVRIWPRRNRGNSVQIDFRWNGQRCRKTLKLEPTKANLLYASRLRATILNAIVTGTFRYSDYFPDFPRAAGEKGHKILISQALFAWLKGIEKTTARSTWIGYESAVRTHLIPTFGDKLLHSITTSDIRS